MEKHRWSTVHQDYISIMNVRPAIVNRTPDAGRTNIHQARIVSGEAVRIDHQLSDIDSLLIKLPNYQHIQMKQLIINVFWIYKKMANQNAFNSRFHSYFASDFSVFQDSNIQCNDKIDSIASFACVIPLSACEFNAWPTSLRTFRILCCV